MARPKGTKSVSQIEAEIAALQAQLQEATATQAQKIGELAIECGLLDVPTAELKKAFQELAKRFRDSADK